MNRKRVRKEILAGVAAAALLCGSLGVQDVYADIVAWGECYRNCDAAR